jgi:class 3 adenylate cyclase/CHASE2 domain-containing sensor protein
VSLNFVKSPPTLIAAIVIVLTCILDSTHNSVAQRLEWITYDARVRFAQQHPGPFANATNLGFVDISDQTIAAVADTNQDSLGYGYGLYWPRTVYADALKELEAEGVKAVAMDVIFSEMRPDLPPAKDGKIQLASDEYFSRQLAQMGNVILAADKELLPADLFTNDAWMVANITTDKDDDGVLRRDEPFKWYRVWHPFIQDLATRADLRLTKTQVRPHQLIIPYKLVDSEPLVLQTDDKGRIDVKKLPHPPPGNVPNFYPFKLTRIWSMGIVLAAAQLKMELTNAQIEPNRIILRGPNGLTRTIPRDEDGTNSFYINWSIGVNDPKLTLYSMNALLRDWKDRQAGTNVPPRFKDKLVVIGSTATGNDLSDLGPTPLAQDMILGSKHWNVANSIITGHFVTDCPLPIKYLLIIAIGSLSAWITWSVAKPLDGTLLMLLMAVVYVGVAWLLFVEFRFWLPVVLPLLCAGLITHVSAITYRVRVEQAEQKRVRGVFQKMLAPEVVHELLGKKNISLGGSRREITIYFADVRGFTELTDVTQARAEQFVRENKLSPEAAEAYYDLQASETLNTVSLYLATIADTIKTHNGTLDKYIGDCVMAFWGGPVANPHHARDAVRSAVAAQLALHALNQQREKANKRKETENASRAAMGLPPDPPLPVLDMGSGLNSGVAIMGLMGSEAHILNYTVFGREVNLASRLESVSGHSRIIISESTFALLQRDDPALAATCVLLPPREVKGIRGALTIYEVPWKPLV